MKCSFCIWLTRESRDWNISEENINFISESSKSHSPIKQCHSQAKPYTSVANIHTPPLQEKGFSNCGLINKGNTCYANAIIQALYALPQFWPSLSSVSPSISSLGVSLAKVMQLLSSSKVPIDPSVFLNALKSTIIKAGKTNFDIFTQQDVPEILEYILGELATDSTSGPNLFENRIKSSVTCNTCFQMKVTEEVMPILQLSPFTSIQESVNQFLEPEYLHGQNAYFCNHCNSNQSAVLRKQILRCSTYLIVQLKRFLTVRNSTMKDVSVVNCCPTSLYIPTVIDNEVSYCKPFTIRASINHSGTLQNGHYTTIAKNVSSNTWTHCNDRAVVSAFVSSLNNNSSYVLFFFCFFLRVIRRRKLLHVGVFMCI